MKPWNSWEFGSEQVRVNQGFLGCTDSQQLGSRVAIARDISSEHRQQLTS